MNRRKVQTGWEKSRDKGIRPAALTPEAKQRRREGLFAHTQFLGQLVRNEWERK